MFTRFYALLRAFTRFYALLRAFTRFYALLRAFTRFYALLNNLLSLLSLLRLQFTVYSVCDLKILRCQSSKRANLYVPKSRNLADLPAVKLIELINRQLS